MPRRLLVVPLAVAVTAFVGTATAAAGAPARLATPPAPAIAAPSALTVAAWFAVCSAHGAASGRAHWIRSRGVRRDPPAAAPKPPPVRPPGGRKRP